MSTRIDELLRDVSAKRLRKHKAAKKELLILADNLENVALIVKGGTLATAVLFMAQSKDYYRYIGVEILIRLCATGEHWAQIAPQRDFFYHTITDMVESYVDEDLSDNPALQNHIRSRVEVMRSTAARLKKLKLRNASSLGDDSGSGSAEGKVVSASDNSVAGPSSSRRRKTRTRSGNYSATRTASRSSTPPIDDDDSPHNDAVDPPRREASKRAARAKRMSSDDTALLATLPPPPLPADEPSATTTTTSSTATVANNNDHATPDPPSQPFVPPPPPTPPVAHEHDPEAPDEHGALYHTRSTPARVGSPAPPLPPASSLRETQSSRSMQNRSPPPLPPAYTRDNQHRSSGGLRRHKQRPKSSAPDRPTMAAPTPGDATRPVISDAQRAKELADDLELLKKLKIQMMVAAGAVGSARKALDKQNTPQNQALLKHAQTRTSQLSAQISELTAKTNSATATPIAQSSHRPAPGSVQLTSTSSAHAVRLVRSMSIDVGNRVTDIKTSEEKGREARLLAMFDIAAATTVTSADQLAPPPSSSSPAVTAADETQSGTAASPSVAADSSSSTRDALHATPERRRSSLAHGETANNGDDADTDEQDAAQREAAAADAEERRRTKRALAAREILDTEQRYVACLASLVDNYKAALDESLATHLKQRKPGPGRGPQPIATAAQIKTMFSNVQAILNTNRVLLAQLRQRVEAWDDATSQLGDVFLRLSDFFKIYIEYANNYDAAQDVLDALLNDSEAFLRFCEAMELVDQLDLGLEDLLIMPVQRLPRYTMLLETLLKYTPKDHADFEHLTQAVAKLADVAQQINDTNREVEQRRKVFEVQQSLDMPENAPPLVAPHRLLECDASCRFVVQENENTRLKAAHVYVFNDLVALAMIPPNPKQQRPQLFCTISLRTGRTARLADQKTGKRGDDIQNALVLIDLARTGQYVLCLGTPAERDQLLEIIEDSKSMTIHRLISRDLVEDRT